MPRIETFIRIAEALEIPLSLIFENMKPITTNEHNASKVKADDTLNKYDLLSSFVSSFNYTKEEIMDIVSYIKYIDFKKQRK